MPLENPNPTQPSAARLSFIDLLRGIACLLVLLFHSWGYQLLTVDSKLTPVLLPLNWLVVGIARRGYLGVHLFLVLSGFCLMWPLVRSGGGAVGILDLKTFAYRRILRIVPAYYGALGLFYVLSFIPTMPLNRPTVWWDIPAHLLLIHNCFATTSRTFSGSFWSLGLEMQLYVAFPFVLWLVKKVGLARTLATTLALSLLWQWAMTEMYPKPTDFGLAVAAYYALPGRLFEFVCGMASAALVAGRNNTLAARAQTLALVVLGVGVVVSGEQPAPFGFGTDQLWGVGFALTIVALGRLSSATFAPRHYRLLVGLGTVSYSVYLIHEPLIQLVSSTFIARGILPAAQFGLTLAVVLPLLIGLGSLFYRLVEAPLTLRKASSSQRSLIKSKTMSEQPGSPS